MWMRGVLTLVWLTLAGIAFLLWTCAAGSLGDSFAGCPSVAALAIPQPLWIAGGLAGVSVIGLVVVWLPYLREARRLHRAQPERALVENIGRLPEPYSDLQLQDGGDPELIAKLHRAVEVVETAFATDSTATRSMTSEWIRLLQEINRLHNTGSLPTEEFKDMNTRLLEAVAVPKADVRS